MEQVVIFLIVIGVMIIFLGALAVWGARENKKARAKLPKKLRDKYPEGHFLSQWMGIGIALGLPFGIPFGNPGLGIPIGVAIGVAIGSAKEEAARKKGLIRPLTASEKKVKKRMVWLALVMFLVGVVVGLGAVLIAG